MDVPVNITTTWAGPDRSTLTSAAAPIKKSFTHYTSKAVLNYVESADSSNYKCTMTIGGGIKSSAMKMIVIGDSFRQWPQLYSSSCVS